VSSQALACPAHATFVPALWDFTAHDQFHFFIIGSPRFQKRDGGELVAGCTILFLSDQHRTSIYTTVKKMYGASLMLESIRLVPTNGFYFVLMVVYEIK
jgi:hypothetical protein